EREDPPRRLRPWRALFGQEGNRDRTLLLRRTHLPYTATAPLTGAVFCRPHRSALKGFGPRPLPVDQIARPDGVGEQFALVEIFIDLSGGLFGLVGEPLEDMLRADFFGPLQPARADQLAKALDRRGVVIGHMLLAVGDVDGAGADWILRRNARRAGVVVTAQRLDADDCKHHRP